MPGEDALGAFVSLVQGTDCASVRKFLAFFGVVCDGFTSQYLGPFYWWGRALIIRELVQPEIVRVLPDGQEGGLVGLCKVAPEFVVFLDFKQRSVRIGCVATYGSVVDDLLIC